VSATAATELAFAGAGALAELVRTRQVRPRELVELYLRRIEALDPRLNAFRTTFAEQALAEADNPAKASGPLAGVPIAIKDDLAVAGQVATMGTTSIHMPASDDAEAVRKLRAAGAIPVGITNVPELMIFPWTATAANGVTRNPWHLERTPGGSSGGSASAVAAGMVAAATGSDGGGSIRIPAASCGLVGMKPTRGRVSTQPARTGWFGLSVFGALARTVSDSALLLDVLHGAMPGDEYAAPPFDGSYLEAASKPPDRLRIAVSRKVPPCLPAGVSQDQRVAWERTAKLLSELGHEVVERSPAYRFAQLDFVRMWLRGVYESTLDVPEATELEPLTRQMAAAGRFLVPPGRRTRLGARQATASARIMALWDEVDVLVTPGTATTAIAAEGAYREPAPLAINRAAHFTPFTSLFNLTGQPAITVPAGIGTDGLPLSVQLVGRFGAEDRLYSLAGQLESAAPWAQRRPPMAIGP
jgi:amidase